MTWACVFAHRCTKPAVFTHATADWLVVTDGHRGLTQSSEPGFPLGEYDSANKQVSPQRSSAISRVGKSWPDAQFLLLLRTVRAISLKQKESIL